MTRRHFARRIGLGAAGAAWWTETALAQRALVYGEVPADTVWLNANENPEGPGKAAIAAMTEVLPKAGRYHYQEVGNFNRAVAASEDLDTSQVLVGAGSSEILQVAVYAFTSPTRPLIHSDPTFELPMGIARSLGHPTVGVPLTPSYAADVKRMVAEAEKAGGGLLYLCNPNNPTSTITPKADMAWLTANLPPGTVALVDEAYLHFATSPDLESALSAVRQGKDVIVARTFSKIYGMAGLRVGFGCAKPDLIDRMARLRSNVISVVSARAVLAALGESHTLVPERRQRLARIRSDLCGWLRDNGFRYLEPHANFVMIDVGREVRELIPLMVRKGVAPGRPFPPLNHMLRVSLGTESDMAKFKRVFLEVMKA